MGTSAVQPDGKEVDYKDIRSKSLIDILMGK
jgi:hypothetical protein